MFLFMFFNLFSTKVSFVDNKHYLNDNYYNDVSMLDTQYLKPNKFKINFKEFSKNSFSVLHLNVRSINKNLESFS